MKYRAYSFSKGEYTFKGSEIDRSFSFSKLDRYFGDTGLNVAESQRQTAFRTYSGTNTHTE